MSTIIFGHDCKTHLGPSISGTCRKLLLFGFGAVGGEGAALANISATGTWGDPKPVEMPYNISWKTLKND